MNERLDLIAFFVLAFLAGFVLGSFISPYFVFNEKLTSDGVIIDYNGKRYKAIGEIGLKYYEETK